MCVLDSRSRQRVAQQRWTICLQARKAEKKWHTDDDTNEDAGQPRAGLYPDASKGRRNPHARRQKPSIEPGADETPPEQDDDEGTKPELA